MNLSQIRSTAKARRYKDTKEMGVLTNGQLMHYAELVKMLSQH